jgi:uncharacterized protein YciI
MFKAINCLSIASVIAFIFSMGLCFETAVAQDGEYKVLGMKLWVIMTRPVPDAPRMPEIGDAHMQHQFKLEREGIMFGAGPYADADGKNLGGMIIIRAANKEEAIRIADSDPMHANGLRTYTLYQWTLNEGHLGISLDFSKGKFSLE